MSPAEQAAQVAAFIADRKPWRPAPCPNGLPATPATERTARRDFHCTAHNVVIRAEQCAWRYLQTTEKPRQQYSNGASQRVWSGRCDGCPAGAERARVLDVSLEDIAEHVERRRAANRGRHRRTAAARVARVNAILDPAQTAARRDAERRRQERAADVHEGGR